MQENEFEYVVKGNLFVLASMCQSQSRDAQKRMNIVRTMQH